MGKRGSAIVVVAFLVFVAFLQGRGTQPSSLGQSATPTAIAQKPTPVQQPTAELQPTATPAASPVLTAQVLASERIVYIANTDGEGAFIRRTPSLDDRVRAYPDGTRLHVTGDESPNEGLTWLRVRMDDGVEGWVPKQYTAESPASAAPTATSLVAVTRQNLAPTATAVPARSTATATSAPPMATAPAATLVPPTPAPTTAPAAVAAVAENAVLGAAKAAWVKTKGNPRQGVIGDLFTPGTEVGWFSDASGQERAGHIELLISGAAIPVAQARERAKPLHPSDARGVRTYTAPAGQTVEVFQSAALAEAFKGAARPAVGSLAAASVFGEEAPGTYIQIAQRGAPTTNRVVIALGNNP